MNWSSLWWKCVSTGNQTRCLCAIHERPLYTKGRWPNSKHACVDCLKQPQGGEDE